jgi:multidrug efflux system membrane fusion protein
MYKINKIIHACLILGILVVGFFIFIFIKGSSQGVKPSIQEIPVAETTTVIQNGAMEYFGYSGEVRGRYESQLAFQVGGKIVQRNVELGSRVKAGQVLMRIDPVDIEQTVNGAKAQLNSAESQYQLAKDNLERFRKLYADHLISKADYDNYHNAYQIAEAGLNQARTQYTDASNKYNYCNLYADVSGVVAMINAETGQVIGAGQPVLTLVRDGEKEVEINVPENRLTELQNAKQIKVTFWALPDVAVVGRVREVAPMADAALHTYKVRVSLINPPAQLQLGMTASVTLSDANGQSAVYIPLSAIYQTGNDPAVWVVNHGVVNLRTITVGVFGDDQVQVLSGLNRGDVIVTAGVHNLQEGQKVRRGDEN